MAAKKSCTPILGLVKAICEQAQLSAFPGTSSPVTVVVTDRGGADYQNNSAMQLFGSLKGSPALCPEGVKSPRDVAQRIADHMKPCDSDKTIAKLEVSGVGFINITLEVSWLASRVQAIVMDGALPPSGPSLRTIVDFSSPNVAKEMHVGHLRSTIIGDTICRILEFCGHQVDRVNHVGDWGTQFGMLIGHLKTVFPDYASKPPPIADLQQFYKDAKKRFDEDEAFKKVAHDEVVRLQGGDGASRYAWGQICDVSRREFEKVYSRLDVTLHEVGESHYNEYIPAVIRHLEEIGSVSESGGAKVIFPPGTKHEQPLIVTKSDGGFSYDSTDMAAIWYRLLEKKADWLVYVTDAGQGPHFELIYAAARAAGWVRPSVRIDHCPHGLVCGEDGKKFKTRSGDVTRLVDLLDEAVNQMLAGLRERAAEQRDAGRVGGRAGVASMSEEELMKTARTLGYSAVKYADLKNNRTSNYIFSYDRMLDDKGNTAVYLLYAGARIASILRNADAKNDVAGYLSAGVRIELKHESELALGRALLRFPEVVQQTLHALFPSVLCDYVYDLCLLFTKFYAACKVIGSAEEGPRLLLLSALEKTLRTAFGLLGIGYLERI